MRPHSSTVWGHSADQGVEPRSGQHAEAGRRPTRRRWAKSGEGHTRGPTIRVSVSGPGQVSSSRGAKRSGSENGHTAIATLLDPTGNRSRQGRSATRCVFCRLDKNVQSRTSRESPLKHRPLQRNGSSFSKHSVQKQRQSASTDGAPTHSHGTRATDLLGRSPEDVKITVKALFAEKRSAGKTARRGNNAVQSEHVQRIAIADFLAKTDLKGPRAGRSLVFRATCEKTCQTTC